MPKGRRSQKDGSYGATTPQVASVSEFVSGTTSSDEASKVSSYGKYNPGPRPKYILGK